METSIKIGYGLITWQKRCDLNVRLDTIKLLEENIGKTHFDINHSKIFYDPPSRVMKIKTKISKWDLIKLKSFCTAKETINKTKRQPSEWEKISANEATDKGLISKIGLPWLAQWLRIHLLMQGTRVRALVREDPICRGATKPVRHNYWACALELANRNDWACVPQLLKPTCLELTLHSKRSHHSEKPVHYNEEQPPLAATRGSPRAAMKTQCSQK